MQSRLAYHEHAAALYIKALDLHLFLWHNSIRISNIWKKIE
jgi:hypothetical protein